MIGALLFQFFEDILGTHAGLDKLLDPALQLLLGAVCLGRCGLLRLLGLQLHDFLLYRADILLYRLQPGLIIGDDGKDALLLFFKIGFGRFPLEELRFDIGNFSSKFSYSCCPWVWTFSMHLQIKYEYFMSDVSIPYILSIFNTIKPA